MITHVHFLSSVCNYVSHEKCILHIMTNCIHVIAESNTVSQLASVSLCTLTHSCMLLYRTLCHINWWGRGSLRRRRNGAMCVDWKFTQMNITVKVSVWGWGSSLLMCVWGWGSSLRMCVCHFIFYLLFNSLSVVFTQTLQLSVGQQLSTLCHLLWWVWCQSLSYSCFLLSLTPHMSHCSWPSHVSLSLSLMCFAVHTPHVYPYVSLTITLLFDCLTIEANDTSLGWG